MAVAVQARSLASLLHEANSPTLKPPTSSNSLEPLVLYIARVPGSKDIFLTPLKPKEKVVSAPDVESCLYYCHVETAADEEIRSQLSSARSYQGEQEPNDDPLLSKPDESGLAQRRREQQQRLPYPEAGTESRLSMPPEPSLRPNAGHLNTLRETQNLQSRPSTRIHRKPVSGGTGGGTSSDAEQVRVPPPSNLAAKGRPPSPQKVLGPRPMLPPKPGSETGQMQVRPLTHSPKKENLRLDQPDSWLDGTAPKQAGATDLRGIEEGFERLSPYGGSVKAPVGAGKGAMFVTLIRRDPGSGDQWNVGQLEIHGGLTSSSSRASRRNSISTDDPGVMLELTNPGYAKFATPRNQAHLEMNTTEASIDAPTFRRWLSLRHPRSPTSASFTESSAQTRNGFRSSLDFSRRSSVQSITELSPNTQQPSISLANTSPSLHPYTFTSPWNGTCTFSTGLAGSSLKCRHILPPPGSAFLSPQFPSSQPSTAPRKAKAKEDGSLVSELRFNLPSASTFFKPPSSSSKPARPPLSASASSFTSNPRSSLSPLAPRPLSQDTSHPAHTRARSHDAAYTSSPYGEQGREDGWDEEEERALDLSLGQEAAGGGFSGKRAKMGKLIVENEGLGMLDLVVAANMGVWWWVAGGGGGEA